MSESATPVGGPREARHRATVRRVGRCAIALTHERGLDGWTMDDLAARTGVSRRTLFNHVASKSQAVIGPGPTFPAAAIERFRAGGPTGDLVEDARVLARIVLDEDLLGIDHDTALQQRQVLFAEPRLMVLVQERFEELADRVVDDVLARPDSPGRESARLLFRVLVALFEESMTRLQDRGEQSLAAHFDTAVDDVRRLLG